MDSELIEIPEPLKSRLQDLCRTALLARHSRGRAYFHLKKSEADLQSLEWEKLSLITEAYDTVGLDIDGPEYLDIDQGCFIRPRVNVWI